jgi:chlorophyll synthase
MPGHWGLYIGIIWSAASLIVAAGLGRWGFGAAVLALALAWSYSAPPLRLKRNGWWGNTAVALCYEGVPWFTGAAIMADRLPASSILMLALLYSCGAHGIMTLNDFKSVQGDRAVGIRSLPAMLGEAAAAKLACVVMIIPQLAVILMMLFSGHRLAGVLVTGLVCVQMFLMVELLDAPRERAIWYNATGTTLYVLGMLVCAFAVGGA